MRKTTILLIMCGMSTTVGAATAGNTDSKLSANTVVTQANEKPPRLSDEQLEQIYALRNKHDDSDALRRVELTSLRRQLRHGLDAESLDKTNLLNIQSKINGLEAEEANDRLTFMLEMRSVLTNEQRHAMRKHSPQNGLKAMALPVVRPPFPPPFPPPPGRMGGPGMFPPPPPHLGFADPGMMSAEPPFEPGPEDGAISDCF